MKKILLLLTIICSAKGFSQDVTSAQIPKSKSYSLSGFLYKNISYVDTVFFDAKVSLNMTDSSIREKILKRSAADGMLHSDHYFSVDSIPEIASININGIRFKSKKILSKIRDYTIFNIKKDSAFSFGIDGKSKVINKGTATHQHPHALVYQEHTNLPHDFFFFKQNTLEAVRYRCYTGSPILDVFTTEDTILAYTKPRVMIDGRLQPKTLDYQNLAFENIKRIDIFGKDDGAKYFGRKAKSGLISIVTNGSNFNIDWALENTRVIAEIQDKKGDWKVFTDTLLTSINQFKAFRKKAYLTNGPIYLIDGESETEQINRKTIDADAIESVKVVSGKKLKTTPLNPIFEIMSEVSEMDKTANDTVLIKMERERWVSKASIGVARVMYDLQRLRKTTPDPEPMYIVDNQEITSEKLKEFKSKELEFVESLEGCDAISRYGKRAEYGVVIYRKKKLE